MWHLVLCEHRSIMQGEYATLIGGYPSMNKSTRANEYDFTLGRYCMLKMQSYNLSVIEFT